MTLHHRIDGPADAPLLVLAGSLGSTLQMWDPQVEALSRRWRLLRYDHPGHGGSPAPALGASVGDLARALLELLDELGEPGRVPIVGLSLGGMVAMWLGIHRPDRVQRLVLCCTSARLGPPEGWDERAAVVRAAGTEAVADAVVERWFTAGFRAAHPAVTAAHRAMIAATPAEGYARCCEAIRDWDGLADLPLIKAPTLVVAGREDPSTPPAHAKAIAQRVSDARLRILSPAAHLASAEQPATLSRLVTRHLEVRR